MPVPALKNLAKKHGVKMKTAEKKWQEAKDIVSKEYDEDSPKYWGTVMNITKNKLAKHSKKHEELDLEMPLFSVNEDYYEILDVISVEDVEEILKNSYVGEDEHEFSNIMAKIHELKFPVPWQ